MQAPVTDPCRRGKSDEVLTHVPVPFALAFRVVAPGVIRCEESNAAQLRAMWAIILVLAVMMGGGLIAGLTQYSRGQVDPRVVIGLTLGVLILGACLFATIRRYRAPLRQLEYDATHRVVRIRIHRGIGSQLEWREYRFGEWAIHVQAAELTRYGWKGGVDWKGFTAVMRLGSDRLILVCSKRRERVLAYVRELSIDDRAVFEDATVMRGQAWLGGDLID